MPRQTTYGLFGQVLEQEPVRTYCTCCPSHFDDCHHCREDDRGVGLRLGQRERQGELHAALRKAGGHGPTVDLATTEAAGALLHCWRGKSVTLEAADLAALMVLLGSAGVLLLRSGLDHEAEAVKEIRGIVDKVLARRMYDAPAWTPPPATVTRRRAAAPPPRP